MGQHLTTLSQWRCAQSVAELGGYANAAEALNKSQSTVSHAISELSARLGIELFRKEGRKAVVTDAGAVLLRRAEKLLRDADALERMAATLNEGHDTELSIAVDIIVPASIVTLGLKKFAEFAPDTRVIVHETVLSGTLEALTEDIADLGLSAFVPPGFVATRLTDVEFVAVAHRDHALHQLGRQLDYDDLRDHRQLVVKDSGRSGQDAGWLEAEQRWTFSNHAGSLEVMKAGAGFAWLPRQKIERELAEGLLRPLPLKYGGRRQAEINLVRRQTFALTPCRQALLDAIIAAAAELEAKTENQRI